MALDSAPEQQQDLRELLRVLWRRKWLLMLLLIGLPLAVYLVSASARDVYAASAIVQVQGAAVDTSLFSPGTGIPQTGAIAAAERLAKTHRVAQGAAERLDPQPSNLKELLDSVEVTSENETGFVTIEAQSFRARRAADIANAFAAELVFARSEQARAQINDTIEGVQRQLDELSRDDTTGRRALSEELQRLRALRAAQNNNAVLVEPALVPDSVASPRPVRNAALALLLAMLIGVGLAFLLDRLDRRIRRPDELRALTGLPILGLLSESAFRPKPDPPLYHSDEIQSLRASLSYFNVDKPLRSIVVSSPAASEGKTTVAANLAISLARSGRDIILIDADLRRSELRERFGLHRELPSLGGVLATGSDLRGALAEIKVDDGRLRVLTAGDPPPNPSELMESDRMLEVIEEAERLCEIVVIDSTPLLPVSDIVPVLRDVSGTILIVRMKSTTSDGLKRAIEIVELAGGNVLGLVGTGVAEHEGGYGYAKGYDRERKGKGKGKRGLVARSKRPAPIQLPNERPKRRAVPEPVPERLPPAAGGGKRRAAPTRASDGRGATDRQSSRGGRALRRD